jgi:large subunit ribosomal protein L19
VRREVYTMNIIKMIEDAQLKENLTDFNVGDTVKVDYKVVEGTRERIQTYEGTVIKKQGEGVRSTFTVRRLSYGVGVERTFPIHSPRIENVTVIRRGKVRRARLFYLRDRQGKAARVKEKRYY